MICAQLQAEVMKLGLNINIIGAGCSTSVVASACAYFGGGPSSFALGNNSDNLLGQEWVTPRGRDHPHRLAEFQLRLVLLGRAGAQPPRHHAGRAGLARRTGHLHQVRHQAGALAGAENAGAQGAAAGLPSADSREHARLHHRRAQLGRMGQLLLRHLRQRHRVHLPPAVQPGRRGLGARAVAHVHRPHQDAQRRGDPRQRPGDQEGHRRGPHLLPIDPGGQLGGGHRAAGQNPRRPPRANRLLQGEALLRAGHGRVHQHVHAASGPQALQFHLGRRLQWEAGCRPARPTS